MFSHNMPNAFEQRRARINTLIENFIGIAPKLKEQDISTAIADFPQYEHCKLLLQDPTYTLFGGRPPSDLDQFVFRNLLSNPSGIQQNFHSVVSSNNCLELYETFYNYVNEVVLKPVDSPCKKPKQRKVAPKPKKAKIPVALKRLVWNKHIGEEVGKAKCKCCNVTDITQLAFNCGHVVAEANGGEVTLDNLWPICQNCNSSIGTMNMVDFKEKFKI